MNSDADNLDSDSARFLELAMQNRNQVEAGLFTDAEDSIQELFDLIEKRFEKNPPANWDLTLEAMACESNRDWSGAEAAYLKILALDSKDLGSTYKAHHDLAGLYGLLNQESEALKHAQLATDAARLDDSTMLRLMMIRSEALYCLRYGYHDKASRLITEAWSLLETDNDGMYGCMRGAILAIRANCELLKGRFKEADADLESSFQCLNPMEPLESGGGIHSNLAYAWAVKAKLSTQQRDFDDAVDAWKKSVSLRKNVAQMPHCANVYSVAAVANALQGLAKALAQVGRQSEANQATSERAEILDFLQLPNDHQSV